MFAIINHVNKFMFKAVALVFLVPLFMANLILKLVSVVYAFVAPIACFGFAAAGIILWLRGNTEPYVWKMVAGAGVGYGMVFALPHISALMDKVLAHLRDYITEPIIVRSPVKYTI